MYNDENNLYHYTYRKDGTEPGQRYDAKQPSVDDQINSYRQQQEQAVDAGRDGEREHCVADLAQKAERQNTRKLRQIVRKDASFGSTEQENTK